MKNQRNVKNTIWIYAIVLFTSAFIVLLVTAYSQIKYNKNLDEYRSNIDSQLNAKNNFAKDLNSVIEENKRLKIQLQDVKNILEETKVKLIDTEVNQKNQKLVFATIIANYERLSKVGLYKSEGEILKAARLLKDYINPKDLNINGVELYEYYIRDIYRPAAELLYRQGYEKYTNKDYSAAIELFGNSLEYTKGEYFSDDCMYFSGYSHYLSGSTEDAKKIMESFIQSFPDSNYVKYANQLLLIK